MKRILLCALALTLLAGCVAPNAAFVDAVDRHTRVILPEYTAYVQADPALDETSKAIRVQSAKALRKLIEQARQAQAVTP